MDPVIAIGEEAPKFHLTDLKGKPHRLEDLRGRIVLLNFWSAECDWCKDVDGELMKFKEAWKDQVRVWWIVANPSEPAELIEKVAKERNLTTVLIDEEQQVVNLYGALTTPHFFVVDAEGKLRYQGAWDDITFRHRVATETYVPKVIETLRNNSIPDVSITPAYGCVIMRLP